MEINKKYAERWRRGSGSTKQGETQEDRGTGRNVIKQIRCEEGKERENIAGKATKIPTASGWGV
jgi:hypothetical protein